MCPTRKNANAHLLIFTINAPLYRDTPSCKFNLYHFIRDAVIIIAIFTIIIFHFICDFELFIRWEPSCVQIQRRLAQIVLHTTINFYLCSHVNLASPICMVDILFLKKGIFSGPEELNKANSRPEASSSQRDRLCLKGNLQKVTLSLCVVHTGESNLWQNCKYPNQT